MIRSWDEFDVRLREIGLIDAAVTEAGRLRDLAVIAAEGDYKASVGFYAARRVVVLKDMEKFYRANRKQVEADGAKSKRLHFGIAGLRKSPPKLKRLKGFTWAKVIDKIRELRFDWAAFVEVKYSLKKDALKRSTLTAEELVELGCKISQDEEFFVETLPEMIAEEFA
jgi:hypothetical protein